MPCVELFLFLDNQLNLPHKHILHQMVLEPLLYTILLNENLIHNVLSFLFLLMLAQTG